MIHTNRVRGIVHGVEPKNRITERLKRRKPSWLSAFLFGNPHDHEPSCLCEKCWRESFGVLTYEEFDGDFCRDCMEPLVRCRCGGPGA